MLEEFVTKNITGARNACTYEEIYECNKEAKTIVKSTKIKLKKVSNLQGK